MKSLLCKDDVAAAIGGFNPTENTVFDIIRFSGLHRRAASPRLSRFKAIIS